MALRLMELKPSSGRVSLSPPKFKNNHLEHFDRGL